MWTRLSTQCTIIYSINKMKGHIQRALKGQGEDLKLWNHTNKTLGETLSNHVFLLSKWKHEMINKQRNSGSVMVICPSCLSQCLKHNAQCTLFFCFHFCLELNLVHNCFTFMVSYEACECKHVVTMTDAFTAIHLRMVIHISLVTAWSGRRQLKVDC